MIAEIQEWCEGRSWVPRALFLLWFAYLGVRYVIDPTASTIFDGLNLGIHEAGHLVFGFGPEVLEAAGGTILQLAAPIGSAVMFARQPDWFALPICGAWLATNLYGVATYVGDARAQALQLVTVGGGEAQHDWTYLLGRFGMLGSDTSIAAFLRVLAFGTMWLSIGAGIWMLSCMAFSDKKNVGWA
ncbi:MAG: hypothetical protein AAF368_08610 [Planctomycetota bacterium]